jgi:hypothetical protein
MDRFHSKPLGNSPAARQPPLHCAGIGRTGQADDVQPEPVELLAQLVAQQPMDCVCFQGKHALYRTVSCARGRKRRRQRSGAGIAFQQTGIRHQRSGICADPQRHHPEYLDTGRAGREIAGDTGPYPLISDAGGHKTTGKDDAGKFYIKEKEPLRPRIQAFPLGPGRGHAVSDFHRDRHSFHKQAFLVAPRTVSVLLSDIENHLLAQDCRDLLRPRFHSGIPLFYFQDSVLEQLRVEEDNEHHAHLIGSCLHRHEPGTDLPGHT